MAHAKPSPSTPAGASSNSGDASDNPSVGSDVSATAAPAAPAEFEAWEAAESVVASSAQLVVTLEGFEGPLDVLLALARTQKVDLAKISVLALADQYLAFIAEARRIRLELAADYLVMAAWLAFLKSRLLLPREAGGEEPSADELAARLAFRLQRLEAMRDAAAKLMTRKRLGRDVFARGMPEGVRTIRVRQYTAKIYDLLKAYAEQRRRTAKRVHVIPRRTVWSIKHARERLEALLGARVGEWVQLAAHLEQFLGIADVARTATASSFGAVLEMAREGIIEISQEQPFAPIYMRRRKEGGDWQRVS
jgi:segregation and condensation protein A